MGHAWLSFRYMSSLNIILIEYGDRTIKHCLHVAAGACTSL